VDVLAVARRSATGRQRRVLVAELLKASGAGAGLRPVGLTLVVQDDVRPWRYPPTCDFLYGEWLREDFERGVTPRPGPGPDPVPAAGLRRAIVAGCRSCWASRPRTPATSCAPSPAAGTPWPTGEIRSKDAAAEWAVVRLPSAHRPALARARAVYLGEEDERRDGVDAGGCAEYLVRMIGERQPA
jgi:streptomycin 3"-adenylyltransferase